MRMKRMKTVTSLILTLVMVLSLAAPFADTVTASGTDDLTGWVKQGGTTTLTGNADDGWQIDFSGSGGSGNYTTYKADMDVSKLTINFNLSQLASGTALNLQIVNAGDREVSALTGTDTKVNFMIQRYSDTQIYIYGYNGSAIGFSAGLKTVDFNVDHTLSFLKSSTGKWVPALDGVALTATSEQIDYYDTFVGNMLAQSSGETYVTFCPWDKSATIKNIKFSADPLADWIKGSDATLSGDEETGFKLDMVSAASSYAANIDISKLLVNFNLSGFTTGNFFMHFLKESDVNVGTYNGVHNDNTKVNFLFVYNQSGTIQIQGIDRVGSGSLEYLFSKTMTITYNDNHTFGFIKNTDGKWVPAFDGVVLTTDTTLVEYYNGFVESMMSSSAGETYVKFSANGNTNTIKDIQFKQHDFTGWVQQGGTTSMVGTPESGWRIAFNGSGGSGNYTTYKADIDVSKLTINLNLSQMASGASFNLQIVDADDRGEKPLIGTDTKVNFMIQRHSDTQIYIYGFNSSAIGFSGGLKTVDFSADHTLSFLKTSTGKWVPALDGIALTETSDQIDYYDTFVETMLTQSPGETYVTFCPWDNNATIKDIKFSADPLADWIKGSGHTVSGNEEEGFQLGMSGDVSSSYASDINVSKLQMHFNLSEFTTGAFFIHFLKETDLTAGKYNGVRNDNTKVNFLFTYGASGAIQIQGIDRVGSNSLQYLFTKNMTITYNDDHTLGFVRNSDGKWVPAFDGEILTSDATLVEYYDGFVNDMMADSSNGTYVKFSSHGSTNTIKNIVMKENLTYKWGKASNHTLSGDEEKGYQLGFNGSTSSSYASSIAVSKLQVNFNLSDFTTGNFFLQFTNKADLGVSAYAGTATKVNFLITYVDENTLKIEGYDNRNVVHNHSFLFYNKQLSFDYTTDHTFGFVKNSAGKWVPVLDGVDLTATESEINYYDSFVTSMLESSPNETYIKITANGSAGTIKSLNFKEKRLLGNSVVLDGTMGVKYYMNLDTDVIANISRASMKFTLPNGTVQTVTECTYDETQGAYVYACELPAKHMADVVKAQLYVDGVAQYDEYEVSVKEYANKLLSNSAQSQAVKTLVTNMLHYGAYAQTYFAYNTDSLANAGLTPLDLTTVEQANFAKDIVKKVEGFGEIVAANLNLKSETNLNLYFDLDESAEGYTFTCEGKEVVTGTENSYFVVTVKNIAAHELDDVFTITATKEGTTYTFTYSVFTYAYNALGKEDSAVRTGLKDLMKAMYLYNTAASAVSSN